MSKQLIKLTVYKRGDKVKSPAVAYAFDVNDIVSPITVNVGGKAEFMYNSTMSQNVGNIVYQVNETMSYIRDLSDKFVRLTVIKMGDQDQDEVDTIFNQDRVFDAIETVPGGSEFYYNDGANPLPVRYIVQETIDEIIAIGAETVAKTGTVVNFVRDAVYGTVTNPESGNITQSLVGARVGTTIVIIHDAAGEPTYPANWNLVSTSGTYDNGKVNFISAVYLDDSNVEYSVMNSDTTTTIATTLTLVFADIDACPVITPTNVNEWNTLFGLPVNGTAFTSVNVSGNTVTLYNGAAITLIASAFASSNLVSISDPDDVIVEIAISAFKDADSLTTATLPGCLTVGAGAFENCDAATSIDIRSCTDLGGTVGDNNVFAGITGNTITLTVPTALNTINAGAPDGDIVELAANNTETIVLI